MNSAKDTKLRPWLTWIWVGNVTHCPIRYQKALSAGGLIIEGSMVRKYASTLIVDLDNTLFDWVEVWHASFEAMLSQIVRISGIDRELLLDEIKPIHQKHGTSEYAFLIEELQSLRNGLSREQVIEKYEPAITAFRAARNEKLKLFPAVRETLVAIREQGTRIIGYTESMAFYTNYRVRKLELDGLLDFLYSPQDHDLPAGLTEEQIRKYPKENYELKSTVHRYTPKGEKKPNPHILQTIALECGARMEDTVYVGDSLMKDVAMAQQAGIVDVHAKYGVKIDTEAYELLRQVTHWTQEDVDREKQISGQRSIAPTHTLELSFSEILAIFKFGSETQISSAETASLLLDAWKKVVEVQQHFNDLE